MYHNRTLKIYNLFSNHKIPNMYFDKGCPMSIKDVRSQGKEVIQCGHFADKGPSHNSIVGR